jgi:hypothetical protein
MRRPNWLARRDAPQWHDSAAMWSEWDPVSTVIDGVFVGLLARRTFFRGVDAICHRCDVAWDSERRGPRIFGEIAIILRGRRDAVAAAEVQLREWLTLFSMDGTGPSGP